jgi:plastocyanin
MKARQETIPGSGLPAAAFLSLLAASIGLFLAWNGLLWRAPREASHVARFAVSYLAVVPLGAILLLGLRRFSWEHLITSTGAVWAIKMVVTAALYQAFARGTATQLQAVAPPPSAFSTSAQLRADYGAATSFTFGDVRGRVRRGGAGLAGAVVFLDAPAPGRAAPATRRVDLVIDGSRYAEPLYLVHADDEVRLLNHDGVLHTAHFSGAGQVPSNRPMPPSAAPHLVSLAEPGVYHVHCDNHPGEATWIVAVDHPYATRTGADGAFSLEGVPAGEARVVVIAADGAVARRAVAAAVVRASEITELTLDLDLASELSP